MVAHSAYVRVRDAPPSYCCMGSHMTMSVRLCINNVGKLVH